MPINSRSKGKNNERNIVLDLKAKGYNACRVPFSGAGREKGDIRVEVPGSRFGDGVYEARFWYLEVKARKDLFHPVHMLCNALISNSSPVLKLCKHGSYAYLAHNFDDVRPDKDLSGTTNIMQVSKDVPRLHPAHKVFSYKKWLESCDLLVIKSNNRRAIYIKYESTIGSKDNGDDISITGLSDS